MEMLGNWGLSMRFEEDGTQMTLDSQPEFVRIPTSLFSEHTPVSNRRLSSYLSGEELGFVDLNGNLYAAVEQLFGIFVWAGVAIRMSKHVYQIEIKHNTRRG
jgi:hypothetical protein